MVASLVLVTQFSGGGAAPGNLLFVTGNGTVSAGDDSARQTFFQGLGWTVTTIDDDAGLPALSAAAAVNDVMYLSDTASAAVGTTVRDLDIGIVAEDVSNWEDLMYGSSDSLGSVGATQIQVTDNTVFPTSTFSVGPVTTAPSSIAHSYWRADVFALPAGAQPLAELTTDPNDKYLVAFEDGSAMYSANTAVNRRVLAGWANPSVASWGTNLETIVARSLEWAASLDAAATSITGTVFEDVDGDGNVGDDGVGVAGVDVWLFHDDGDGEPSFGDTIADTAVTDGSGTYTLAATDGDATYWVVANGADITPAAGYSATGSIDDVFAEQTHGPAGSATFDGTWSFTGSAGALFGGARPAATDGFPSLPASDHVARVVISGADRSGVDFGFSFSPVTNTGDEVLASGFTDVDAWATFDAGANGVGTDPDGYRDPVFDGRYVYFPPADNGSGPHSEVLRYDTQADFGTSGAWTTYDPIAAGVGSSTGDFRNAFFDGRYVYFVPYGTPRHGEFLRYDTTADFSTPSSWTAYDPSANGVGTDPIGYLATAFDGRYLYFAPDSNGSGQHGEVLRYDTSASFTSSSSWTAYTPDDNGVGTDPRGYFGAIFDGRYVYFVPFLNGGHHGEVLRYDTTRSFTSTSAWATYDPGANGVGTDPDGFIGGTFDGRYLYLVPYFDGTDNHGEVLRFDTTADFQTNSSWTAFDPGTNGVGTDPDGYAGAAFDGRFVYLIPLESGSGRHGEFLRYDTTGSFTSTASWVSFDPGTAGVGTDPDGLFGAVFDGRYLYVSPGTSNGTAHHGEVVRYDTQRANQGTLRQFIDNSNAVAGVQTTNFEIPVSDAGHNSGTWTISPDVGGLPDANEPIVLDATTQAGWVDDPVIEIDGSSATGATAGIRLRTSNSTVRGFSVHSSTDEGIEIDASERPADNNVIAGNWVGVDLDGVVRGNADHGILLTVGAASNVIGGSVAADANVISGNTGSGVLVRNVGSDDNVVTGNLIGTLADGTTPAANARYGVEVHDLALRTRIGGTGAGEGNLIANSSLDGVAVTGAADDTAILGNSIVGNTGLGIDLEADGVSANDGGDVDTGANGLLNFPVVTGGSDTTIGFQLDVAAGEYLIEGFRNPSGNDPSGNGEAEISLGFHQITHTGSGTESFIGTFSGVTGGGDITLTATRCLDVGCTTFGSTSELSAATTPTTVVTVNSTGDGADTSPGDGVCDTGGTNSQGADECTLRAAIEEASANGVINRIEFVMPTSEAGHSAGVWTITPGSALPGLTTASLVVDATTQPGYATTPIVEIDGISTAAGTDGLELQASGITIRGFAINRFPADAIEVDAPGSGATIVGNHLGIDPSGLIARGNGSFGVDLQSGSTGSTIGGTTAADRNVISGNNIGIYVNGSDGNTIIGNHIGTDATGIAATANVADGIYAFNGADNNVIGQPGAGNVISGNGDVGIEINGATAGNTIRANLVGLGADGTTPVANSRHGIVLYDGVNTTQIGGTGTGEGNTVSSNAVDGIVVDGNANAATADNVIVGNVIGLSSDRTTARGNINDGISVFGGAGATIVGGTASGSGNVISGNGDEGVQVGGASTGPVTVLGNELRSNTGLGIDLVDAGDPVTDVTSNDADDGDGGPNDLLNFPVITAASSATVDFDLDVPAGDYLVQAFRNPSGNDPTGHGEGEVVLGSDQIAHAGSGSQSFTGTFADLGGGGDVTLTVTECDDGTCTSFGSTSEFSLAASVSCADSDGDGLCDSFESLFGDTDGDTLANENDADDDGDGVPTAGENADPNGDGDPSDALDSDRDGQPDYLDVEAGPSTTPVADQQKISETSGGLAITLTTTDRFGRGVAPIGDLDGDGVNDLVAGIPFDDDGGSDRGAVVVLFLNPDGTVKAEQKISDTVGGLSAVLGNSDQFGIGVAGLGDIDGDGLPDIAVGAHQDDDGGGNHGAVHVLFLDIDGTVKAEQKISDTQGGLGATLAANDRFGSALSGLGDLDGDGINDLAVGAKDDNDGFADAGAVYVLFLDADGTVKAEQKISDTQGGLGAALGSTEGFGIGVAGIGDVDDDGNADLAVGAHFDDDGGTNRGAVHVLFLNSDGTVRAEQKISDTQGGLGAVLDNNDAFGSAVGPVGDVDGDGVEDLVVGAPSDDDGSSQSGAVYVLLLNTDGTVKAEEKISAISGGLTGLGGSDQFGFAVHGLGDLDGDGQLTLAVHAFGDDDGGPADRGAVYVLDLDSLSVDVSGTVFEDVDGDGDVTDDGVGAAGVDVWLFQDADGDGEPSAGDTVVDTTYTDGSGDFTLTTEEGDGTYWVAVNARDIAPSTGYAVGGSIDDVFAEQTYGPAGAATFDGTWSFAGSAGALHGGARPTDSDGFPTLPRAEHVTRAVVSGADVAGLDHGFSFVPITNTLDDVLPSGFTDTAAWSTYDPGANGVGVDADGYDDAVFDGRYLYFVPDDNGSGAHGEILRYDTTASFSSSTSWQAFDPGANGVGVDADGYRGATFDGRYIYFAPNNNGSGAHGEVLRYDTTASFTAPASWATFDPSSNGVGTNARGYIGTTFDGRYVYFSPYAAGGAPHGEVLRYDTTADFATPASWTAYDPGANGVGTDPDGYTDVVFDGRHLYFVPWENGTEYHGEVLRYDTRGNFSTAGSWSTFDPGANGVGADPDGYIGATFDGRHLYFTPLFNGSANHGEVLRYDTTGSFSSPASWAAYDAGANGVGVDADGYEDAEFDGRYVYFAPTFNGTAQHGEVLRFDTLGSFSAPGSWDAFDPGSNAVGSDADGYVGVASDGRYLYFTPSNNGTAVHGEFLRHDTRRANQGTLRQFIDNSNAVGGTQISNFEIPTSDPGHSAGVWTISPTAGHPALEDPAVVDATTQPGWTSDPVIELDGASATGATAGILVWGSNSTVRGFSVHSFPDEGIEIDRQFVAADGNVIAANWVGVDADGVVRGNAEHGVLLTTGASANTIGGPNPADRNVIAGNGLSGVLVRSVDSVDNVVENNLVGVLPDGLTAAGNTTDAVAIETGADRTIVRDNVIAHPGGDGIDISGTVDGTIVQGNTIGTDSGRTATWPGRFAGVSISAGATNSLIGGTSAGQGNVITNAGTDSANPHGVTIAADAGASHTVLGNSIVGNAGLAIDLVDAGDPTSGVTANDAGDVDSGPNDLLNFPVITASTTSTIDFDLDVPAGDYLVEAFRNPSGADASGHGEAEVGLGVHQIAHTGSGTESFTGTFSGVAVDGPVAMTVTRCANAGCTAFGPTSELSLAAATSSVVLVNSTGDGPDATPGDGACDTGGTNSDGADECTLRAAIDEVNARVALDTIHFSIPTSDTGYSAVSPIGWTIQPASSLPTISSPTAVDGSTQTGFVDAPLIALDGSVAIGTGLVFSGGNSTLRSLALHSFDDGVQLTGAGGNTVAGVWIGLLLDGTTSAPLLDEGIKLEPTSPNNTIGGPVAADRNVIAGAGVFSNNTEGIYVRSDDNVIEGNYLGTDSTGLLDRGYDDEAIDIANSSDNIVRDNVIAFNAGGGMQLSSTTRTTIVGNLIGVAADGVTPAGNGFVGIETINTNSDVVIGGTNSGDSNVIAHSGDEGLRIRAASSTTVTVIGNEIRDNGDLGIDLVDAGDPATGVTPNDVDDVDTGSNGLLNFPVLGAPVGGETSLEIDLDAPAGDYRIEVFANPSGTDPSGHGEGETLIHAETVTSTGAVGDESFTLAGLPVLSPGQVLTATATEDLGGNSYGGTSEFSLAVTVASPAGVLDRSVRRHDMSAFGGLDVATPGSGVAGGGFDLAGGGERLSGPAFDPVETALTMSGWVNLATFSGESAVVAKTGSGGTIHELLVDGGTGEAVARVLVGASTIEARGGAVTTGTWHQLSATWDGADLRLYVDGAQIDSTAAVGTLGDDRSIPVTVGDTSIQSAALVGSVDQVTLGRTARSADHVATEYLNLSDPTGMISLGAPQTDAPAAWATTTSTTRTGSHALDAPNVTTGASPWLVAAGLDEPGLAFESWWYLTDPAAASTASGTNTQDSPTDQREVRANAAGLDLAAIEGATRTVDATSGTTVGTATWTKVEIRTDETGTSSVLIDGAPVIASTAHSNGTSSGSAGFRVETLPGGDSWLVDDVRLRRLVSDEPMTSLAPLHRQ